MEEVLSGPRLLVNTVNIVMTMYILVSQFSSIGFNVMVQNELHRANETIVDLKSQLQAEKTRCQELMNANEILEENISKLYTTAKTELERKTKAIESLQRE